MALTAVVLRGRLGEHNLFTNPAVMHDFGKMVFAFSVFWVYLVFAQYIVIWYGDLPVETFFLVQRVHHMPWSPLSSGMPGVDLADPVRGADERADQEDAGDSRHRGGSGTRRNVARALRAGGSVVVARRDSIWADAISDLDRISRRISDFARCRD